MLLQADLVFDNCIIVKSTDCLCYWVLLVWKTVVFAALCLTWCFLFLICCSHLAVVSRDERFRVQSDFFPTVILFHFMTLDTWMMSDLCVLPCFCVFTIPSALIHWFNRWTTKIDLHKSYSVNLTNPQKLTEKSFMNVSSLAFSSLSSDCVSTVLKLWWKAVTWGYTAGCHDAILYMVLTLVFSTKWSEVQYGSKAPGHNAPRIYNAFPSIFIFPLLWSVQVFDEIVLDTLAVLLLWLLFQKKQFYCSCVCGDVTLRARVHTT